MHTPHADEPQFHKAVTARRACIGTQCLMRQILIGFFLVGAVSLAHAAQQHVPRPTLCALSQTVVIAEVTDRESFWTDEGRIHTRVHLAVLETIKGPESTDLDIELRGGRLHDLTYTVPEEAQLLTNAQYLLFVGPVDGRVGILGGEQGAIRVLPDGRGHGETRSDALASLGDCDAN